MRRISAVILAAVLALALCGACSKKEAPEPRAPMSDEELTAATGMNSEVFGLVRAAGGRSLEPLMAEGGGRTAGLKFEAPSVKGGPGSLRPALLKPLEEHGCRVYIIDQVVAVGPNSKVSEFNYIYAVLASMDPFEPLRVMKTRLSAKQDTEQLIEELKTLNGRAPLDVASAGVDFLNVQFTGPVYPEWRALAGELFDRYPESTRLWWETPEEMAGEMENCRCLDLAKD